jgi:glutathione peroxidase-family protein
MDAAGGERSLAGYRGKVLFIVNTAAGCGFTPQYRGLPSARSTAMTQSPFTSGLKRKKAALEAAI